MLSMRDHCALESAHNLNDPSFQFLNSRQPSSSVSRVCIGILGRARSAQLIHSRHGRSYRAGRPNRVCLIAGPSPNLNRKMNIPQCSFASSVTYTYEW